MICPGCDTTFERTWNRQRYCTRACQRRTHTKAWRKANPEAQARHEWASKIKAKYGVTPEQYECMLVCQGGACAICGEGHTDDLVIDHDHVTGEVRGLLCRTCNTGIGGLRDSRDLLAHADAYLRAA